MHGLTLCDDCRLAETDRLHAIYWTDRARCIARRLAAVPKRFRQAACEAARWHGEWAAIRARLVALLGAA
jgi:hypothetical protein